MLEGCCKVDEGGRHIAMAQSAVILAVGILLITELVVAMKNYYDTLGVSRDATERHIKRAFHKLAMKYHPDRNKSPDAEVKFREIAEAYETLSDESRRREYDHFGAASYVTEDNQSKDRPSGFPFDFNDIFKDVGIFSQNRHARQHRAFREHSRSQRRHQGHSEGGVGADVFEDVEDLERMFTFDGHAKQTQNRFHAPSKQHCRTVTQRRGNMVTTYTDCTVAE